MICQGDFSGRTIYAYSILSQPVHSQNNIQLGGLDDYQSGWKPDSLDIHFQFFVDLIAFEHGSRGLNQDTFSQKRARKFVLGNETLRNKRVGSPGVK